MSDEQLQPKQSYKMLIEVNFDTARTLPDIHFVGSLEDAGTAMELLGSPPADLDEKVSTAKITLSKKD